MYNPGPRRFCMAAAVAVMAGACSAETADPTLRVVTTWSDLTVEQLSYAFSTAEGEPLGSPQIRPEAPAGPLQSGADLLVHLPRHQLDRPLRCEVQGLAAGQVVAAGAETVLAKRGLVLVRVMLAPRGPEAAGVSLGGDGGAGADGPTGRREGDPCTAASQCRSGYCTDGVCCNSACGGLCQSCRVPGSEGACGPMPTGAAHPLCVASPAESCGFDGTCDGYAGCRKHPAGVMCAPGVCQGSSVVAARACDGAGACAPGPVIPCAPYTCDPSGTRPTCHTRCTSGAECIPGRRCENGSCGKKIDGAACASDGDCQSGFCTDGLCCNSRCDGACSSCTLPGFRGVCVPVPAGTQDPRGGCQDEGATTCGTNGTCDGKGGCAKYPAGAICRPATCTSASVRKAPSRCDGLGACQQGGELSCAPFLCRDGACTETCQAPADCAPGATCDEGRSCGKRGSGQRCSQAGQCESGLCVDGVCCAEACEGPCRSCAEGLVPGTCSLTAIGIDDPRGQCPKTARSTCGPDGACDGRGACRKQPAGTVCAPPTCDQAGNERRVASACDGAGACVPGGTASCAPYRCNGTVCFTACGTDADCAPPALCYGGACGLRPIGDACRSSAECASAHCADGVCCEAQTCGPCTACNVAGALGVCTPVPNGQRDPRGACGAESLASCGKDGFCDGAGACRKHPASTPCGAQRCDADGVTLLLAPTCDGKGTCSKSLRHSCLPYECDATSNSCRSSCAGNGDCTPPNLCGPNRSCGDLKALGRTCNAGSECASGNCADGVCCSTGSCPSCRACNVAGSAGSCAPVTAGATDPRGVCLAQEGSSCGFDGKCDGAGACRKHPAGTLCAEGSCEGNVARPSAGCDGNGVCLSPAGTIDCGAYRCSAGVCRSSCRTDEDCATDYSCLGTTCQLKSQGASCARGAQCQTGHCTNGVCCEAATCGTCRACNVAGFLGFCRDLPAGATAPASACPASDPSTCGLDGKCDGAGRCRKHTAGTVCAPASCAGRTLNEARTCDGLGECKGRGSTSCLPFNCDASTVTCFTSCTSNAQCAFSRTCKNGGCQ